MKELALIGANSFLKEITPVLVDFISWRSKQEVRKVVFFSKMTKKHRFVSMLPNMKTTVFFGGFFSAFMYSILCVIMVKICAHIFLLEVVSAVYHLPYILMSVIVGTLKNYMFPFVSNGELIIFRCPKI